MKLYKTTLTLRSASASQWQADTIFGHLCWFLVRQKGEAGLQAFLHPYEQGQPTVLVSDGFPADYLPRPQMPRKIAPTVSSKRERVERLRGAKKTARSVWLTVDDFNRVRQGLEPVVWPSSDDLRQAIRDQYIPKNQINRLTGTTTSESDVGQLFEQQEIILRQVSLFWKIEAPYLELVNDFLSDLTSTGYGRRKSVGYGQIQSISPLEEFQGFTAISEANGFVTLSRFVPAPNDPIDGCWQTVVKYGKLGEELAVSPNPFKRPLIQLDCGSCFYDSPPREWYGQLIDQVSSIETVRHYAFAFAVPIKLPV